MGIKSRTFVDGRAVFLAGVFDALHVPGIVDQALRAGTGRRPKIPYGVLAKLMLINICDQHHPLYRLSEYYESKDLERLTRYSIDSEALEDHRFGQFLDRFFQCNPRAVFQTVALSAFVKYGLSIRTLNYDTTSKVMWGQYECGDGQLSAVYVTFGHSKDHRPDKKQLKIGIGTSDGAIADARVLNGNLDDKTYNNMVLDDVETILLQHAVSKDTFYYIADAAFFTQKNVEKAVEKRLRFITRVPETVALTKNLIEAAWAQESVYRCVTHTNAHNEPVVYHIQEFTDEYRDVPCVFTVCYSEALERQKQKTAARHAKQEQEALEKLATTYEKRKFACEADARSEIETLTKKQLAKVKYHTVECAIAAQEKRKRGRPPANPSQVTKEYNYHLRIEFQFNAATLAERVKRQATFVLASNNLQATGEEILAEYKSQQSVEKKFQQLKSPHIINSIFLNKPSRIEAFVYLLLLAMMSLSVIERVVRREMAAHGQTIIGPGKVRMTKPTLQAISDLFVNVMANRIEHEGRVFRQLEKPLTKSQTLILNHLGISPDIFTDGR